MPESDTEVTVVWPSARSRRPVTASFFSTTPVSTGRTNRLPVPSSTRSIVSPTCGASFLASVSAHAGVPVSAASQAIAASHGIPLVRVAPEPRTSSRHRSRPATCSAPAGLVSSLLKGSGATVAVHKSHRLLRVPPTGCSPGLNELGTMSVARGCPCPGAGVRRRARAALSRMRVPESRVTRIRLRMPSPVARSPAAVVRCSRYRGETPAARRSS